MELRCLRVLLKYKISHKEIGACRKIYRFCRVAYILKKNIPTDNNSLDQKFDLYTWPTGRYLVLLQQTFMSL